MKKKFFMPFPEDEDSEKETDRNSKKNKNKNKSNGKQKSRQKIEPVINGVPSKRFNGDFFDETSINAFLAWEENTKIELFIYENDEQTIVEHILGTIKKYLNITNTVRLAEIRKFLLEKMNIRNSHTMYQILETILEVRALQDKSSPEG